MCQSHNFHVQKNVKIRQEKNQHYHAVFSLHFLFVASGDHWYKDVEKVPIIHKKI